MRILILYGTSEGHTRKVASFLTHRLQASGCEVTLLDAATRPLVDPAAFEATILAGRVHAGHYPRRLVRFARRNAAALDPRPSAFVSVSMLAAIPGDKVATTLSRYVNRFAKRTHWMPRFVHHAAGARYYTRRNSLTRRILAWVDRGVWGHPVDTSRDYEWTDWAALSRFADSFLTSARRSSPGDMRNAKGAEFTVSVE